jgi:hypothetical protein
MHSFIHKVSMPKENDNSIDVNFIHFDHKDFLGNRPKSPQQCSLWKTLMLEGSIRPNTYPRTQKQTKQGVGPRGD